MKGGDLDHRVAGLKDEFGELATSFNEMAGSLKEQMQKMQRTEQMVVVGELAAGLAHEIKNPMAGIKVAMSVLSEEAYISPEDKAVLQKVVAEITQLEGLMKSFLNFAKPQKPRLEPVNVNQMLNTTLTFHLKHQAVGAGGSGKIEIVKEFGELPPTLADPTQLQQVFLNLFLNALHAMPRGGELGVRTRLEEDGKTIRIEVSDTGSGIREDLITKVFQPFFTTKPKGTGLGLAISRQMIEQHDGTIAVANRPGGGVLFTILLPVKAEGAAGMKTKGKVFLLDDDELIVSMLERALRGDGYDVRAESDPEGVLDRIRAFSPDVVLLDIKLPGRDGIDILGEIVGQGVRTQVVMLTSDDTAETAVKAMKIGAADYLTKPFNLDEVKIVVGRHHREREPEARGRIPSEDQFRPDPTRRSSGKRTRSTS